MFKGCYVALVTPFRDDKVDLAKLDELVDWHLDQGTDGLVPCGTTGESPTLSHDEHNKVIEAVVKRVDGRVPVIAGTGSNSTREAIDMTKYAADVGADASLQVSPYYNKPEPEGMYRHFEAIAQAADLPMVLYNVPGRTGRAIEVETIVRLADIPNVVALKHAMQDLDPVTEIKRRCEIEVLSGEDALTLPLLSVGGQGVISVVGNIAPKPMSDMVHAYLDGDVARAQALHAKLFPLCKAMFLETNPLPVKAAMTMLGRLNGEMRLPLTPMSEGKEPALRQELREFGLL